MFTGIITDQGRVLELEKRGDLRARIATHYDVDGIDIGASIACDGVCLTVIALGRSQKTGLTSKSLPKRLGPPIWVRGPWGISPIWNGR